MRYEVELTDEQARAFERTFDAGYSDSGACSQAARAVGDAIRAQMPKPRMAEPGWGEKVIAHTYGDETRRPFVRWHATATQRWHDGYGWSCSWINLLDPQPVDGAQ